MAGKVYWDGSTSTDCTAAANWTAGIPAGSTPPAAGDEVIFDGRTIANDATTVCAVGDTGGIDYDFLHVKSGHSGTIGAAGAPFHTSAQKIIIEGTGTYYIEVSESTAVSQIVPLVIINNPAATVYLTSNINTVDECCEFTTIIVLACAHLYIGNNGSAAVDTAVQYLYVVPNQKSYATIIIEEDCERYKATTYKMIIIMTNGTLITDSAATEIVLYNGTFTYGSDGAAETGMDITTLRQYGGTFYWQPDDSGDDVYIGDLWLYGGTFDASSTTNNDRFKVLGNGAGHDIYVFEGATMNLRNNMGNISIADDSQLFNFGGTILTDNYTELGISYDQA